MRERRQIVELWERGDAAVLATLVRVEGSSYRRPGARLLIASNGDYAGAISGGCLETEVIRKAQWLVRDGATVQRYSTLFDDTADIPYGLGCGGTVDVLLEPANTPEFNTLIHAIKLTLSGESSVVETLLPSVTTKLRRTISAPHFEASPLGTSDQVFREELAPPQRLILFGAGDDAQPMARMAALLGWSVVVLDSRSQWARPERFPEAEQVLAASTLDDITISKSDAVVLMSHSYEQDRAWLAAVLPAAPRYLGLLGARHRSALLLSEAAALLNWPLDKVCSRVFAPVGLDLGGDGAEAIALATISEIQASCQGKLDIARRLTPQAIAEQIARGGASAYLQTQCAV
jgi:xanthine/CO dehydrogenase XdhC/CoxF family maturation factor